MILKKSKKTKVEEFITEDELQWLKDTKRIRNFTITIVNEIKHPIIDKDILMPKIVTKKNKKDDRS